MIIFNRTWSCLIQWIVRWQSDLVNRKESRLPVCDQPHHLNNGKQRKGGEVCRTMHLCVLHMHFISILSLLDYWYCNYHIATRQLFILFLTVKCWTIKLLAKRAYETGPTLSRHSLMKLLKLLKHLSHWL